MNDVYKNKAPYTLKEKRAIVGLNTLKTLEGIVEKYMTEHAEHPEVKVRPVTDYRSELEKSDAP